MAVSAYNSSTGQFVENDSTKPLDNIDLQNWMSDNRAAALPAAAGQLFAATGTAGVAMPIALGAGLALGLVNGVMTLSVTGGTSPIDTTNALTDGLGNYLADDAGLLLLAG